ncbi:MAG: isopentenyl pyrophosphate isomerase [Paenibacillaceae bacterium]|jgi:isopentenyl-diphosphate delta-isomerase|nr:isopentenyl pyrophosphate isomerase [Paenibacillaceae bacterium]
MRISRKLEHIRHALSTGQSGRQGFADVKLVPNALPEISLDSISLASSIGELVLSSPIIINAMTGGAPETEEINRKLAAAARETGTAMAVGSQMSAIANKEMRASYQVVRQTNPDGIILANLGSEATVRQAREAVEMIGANGLQIHLNVMQELLMPEGERDFRGATERIARIVQELPVPVIVKEVGFGIAREPALKLKEAGVRILDVGGTGGTSFAAIENARRNPPMDSLNDWGCTTSVALLECADSFQEGWIIATGGIRSGMDVAKALALGASAAGISGLFLKALFEEGEQGLQTAIVRCLQETAIVMAALGAADVQSMHSLPVVITGETAEWCQLRGIDLSLLARRQSK